MSVTLRNKLRPVIPLISKTLTLINIVTGRRVKGNGEFCKRIKYRHRTFWQAPNAETVRNTNMDAKDPVAKWQDVEHWQRKLSNKYNAREFAKKHGCRVPDLYWKGKDVNNINFNTLPPNYVIRPTIGHSCGLVFLMDHGTNIMDKQPYTSDAILQILRDALEKNNDLEFLVEEFIRSEEGLYRIPIDYKFYMFNGELATIQVISRVRTTKAVTSWYNQDWKEMKNVNTYYAKGHHQHPPKYLKEMIACARELSRAYEIFVRVDFYATDKGPVFGEFTPTPAVGDYFTRYGDKLFVEYWDKYCKELI